MVRMLRSLKELLNYKILTTDESFGKVDDFFFDDRDWVIRYMVLDTHKWLTGRKLLIPPVALDRPNWEARVLPVKISKEEILKSPSISKHEPVSMQHEKKLYDYFGWHPYWIKGGLLDSPVTEPDREVESKPESYDGTIGEINEDNAPNAHLRSIREIIGYLVRAKDGKVGHVRDLIVDDNTWEIIYAVINTRKELDREEVLVAVKWIDEIDWQDSHVRIILKTETVNKSPVYDPGEPINREYEEMLFDYYGRPKYWI